MKKKQKNKEEIEKYKKMIEQINNATDYLCAKQYFNYIRSK